MADARTFALSVMLVCACACAASPKPLAPAKPEVAVARAELRAPADTLQMRDMRRSEPKEQTLGALRPVQVGSESLSKQATGK